jgi:hypothetical protein
MPSEVAESKALTVYAVEGWLEALENVDGMVTPDQQQAFELELAQALQSTHRTERVAQSILQLEAEVEFGKQEIRRIKARCDRIEAFVEHLREGVLNFIKALGADRNGRFPALAGRTATMSARANPASVLITDPEEVPIRYKRAVVQLPYDMWLSIVEAHPHATAGHLQEVKIDKAAIKEAIRRGEEVAGADLDISQYHLRVG